MSEVATATPQERPPLLEVRNLRVAGVDACGKRKVMLDDVSISLAVGEVVALVGMGGGALAQAICGDSSGGNVVAGGQILFHGHDLQALTSDARRSVRGAKIAYIGSGAGAFNPLHSFYDQICEVALTHGIADATQARTEAIRLFKELDLPNPEVFGKFRPHDVPAGLLHRAGAAMALAAKPELLVFDDPTADLDLVSQADTLAWYRRLVRDHKIAALYVTKDLAIGAQLASRIAVLEQGRIVEEGQTATVLRAPQSEYARRMVAVRATPLSSATLRTGGAEPQLVLAAREIVATLRDDSTLVDGASIELPRGETVALVGEPDSGKDALIRVIAGILPWQAGEILLGAESLPTRPENRSREQRRRIQMIHRLPGSSLNPRHLVFEIVGRPISFYFRRSRRETRARVEELMTLMGLSLEVISQRPCSLSKGDRQRVSIARALAAEPDVIICDDVTLALDPLATEDVLHALRRAQERTGVACLFSTGDIGVARRLAGKMTVMARGQVAAHGPMLQVLSPPYHPYTELLLTCVPEARTDWLDDVVRKRRKIVR